MPVRAPASLRDAGVRLARALIAVLFVAGAALLVPATPARADTVREKQWQLGFLKARDAWKLSTGKGITVAVIDSGVDANHPDLRGQVLPGADFVDGTTDGRVDFVGHGTTVAALIAGRADDSDGVIGLAPDAKILPIRVLDAENRYESGDVVARAVMWAVDRGAQVINLSLGSAEAAGTLSQAVQYAFDRNVVVVACDGNLSNKRGTLVWHPAREPGVLAVSGVTAQGRFWDGSLQGPATVIAAPASNIVGANRGGEYWNVQGTSFASPIVAASAALVRARFPTMTAANVVNRLVQSAWDFGTPGRDDEFGFGVVNPVRALNSNIQPVRKNPLLGGAPIVGKAGRAAGGGPDEPGSPNGAGNPQALKPSTPSPWLPRSGLVLGGLAALLLALVAVALVLNGSVRTRRADRVLVLDTLPPGAARAARDILFGDAQRSADPAVDDARHTRRTAPSPPPGPGRRYPGRHVARSRVALPLPKPSTVQPPNVQPENVQPDDAELTSASAGPDAPPAERRRPSRLARRRADRAALKAREAEQARAAAQARAAEQARAAARDKAKTAEDAPQSATPTTWGPPARGVAQPPASADAGPTSRPEPRRPATGRAKVPDSPWSSADVPTESPAEPANAQPDGRPEAAQAEPAAAQPAEAQPADAQLADAEPLAVAEPADAPVAEPAEEQSLASWLNAVQDIASMAAVAGARQDTGFDEGLPVDLAGDTNEPDDDSAAARFRRTDADKPEPPRDPRASNSTASERPRPHSRRGGSGEPAAPADTTEPTAEHPAGVPASAPGAGDEDGRSDEAARSSEAARPDDAVADAAAAFFADLPKLTALTPQEAALLASAVASTPDPDEEDPADLAAAMLRSILDGVQADVEKQRREAEAAPATVPAGADASESPDSPARAADSPASTDSPADTDSPASTSTPAGSDPRAAAADRRTLSAVPSQPTGARDDLPIAAVGASSEPVPSAGAAPADGQPDDTDESAAGGRTAVRAARATSALRGALRRLRPRRPSSGR